MRLHAKALREIRSRSGMSVTSLARAAGIKQSHLSNIEAGRRQASDEVIVALARALKVELPAILAEPPPSPAPPSGTGTEPAVASREPTGESTRSVRSSHAREAS